MEGYWPLSVRPVQDPVADRLARHPRVARMLMRIAIETESARRDLGGDMDISRRQLAQLLGLWDTPRRSPSECRGGPHQGSTPPRANAAADGPQTLSQEKAHGEMISTLWTSQFGAAAADSALMSLWGEVFAAGYDGLMAGPEKAVLRGRREALVSRLTGDVLEIGGGTGANLPFYGPGVEQLVITEPEEPMARRLERKLAGYSLPARVVRAPAEELPLEDASFDFVVSTLVLCTVDDPARALTEIHRVLKPGGRLVFLEHVRSDDPRLARWQDRLHGVQVRVGHGCHCNRRTLENIERAGFSIAELEHDRMRKAPPIVRPLIAGLARASA